MIACDTQQKSQILIAGASKTSAIDLIKTKETHDLPSRISEQEVSDISVIL